MKNVFFITLVSLVNIVSSQSLFENPIWIKLKRVKEIRMEESSFQKKNELLNSWEAKYNKQGVIQSKCYYNAKSDTLKYISFFKNKGENCKIIYKPQNDVLSIASKAFPYGFIEKKEIHYNVRNDIKVIYETYEDGTIKSSVYEYNDSNELILITHKVDNDIVYKMSFFYEYW